MQQRFWIDAQRQHDTFRVMPVGEVDIASASELEAVIKEAEDSDAERVLVDLRGVTFIDASGLRCVLAAHEYSRSNGHKLRIIQGGWQVQKVFELTGLAQKLPFVKGPAPERGSS